MWQGSRKRQFITGTPAPHDFCRLETQHAEAASEKYEQRCSEASQTIEALKVIEDKPK